MHVAIDIGAIWGLLSALAGVLLTRRLPWLDEDV